MNRTQRRDGQDGFTLIELLVGLAISAIAAMAIFGIFIGTQNTYYDTRVRVREVGDVRTVFTLLGSEIRSAGSDAVGRDVAGDGIMTATSNSLSLRSDLDGDNTIEYTEPPEMVTYAYSAANHTLTRDTGAGPVLLLQNLDDFSFTFLDRDGNTMVVDSNTNLRDISSVRIRVQVSRSSGDAEVQECTYTFRNH